GRGSGRVRRPAVPSARRHRARRTGRQAARDAPRGRVLRRSLAAGRRAQDRRRDRGDPGALPDGLARDASGDARRRSGRGVGPARDGREPAAGTVTALDGAAVRIRAATAEDLPAAFDVTWRCDHGDAPPPTDPERLRYLDHELATGRMAVAEAPGGEIVA